ncbi:MAG: hypothetical protein ACI39W_03130 [Brotaphodocola sp.]
MYFSEHLYVGKKAQPVKKQILELLEQKKLQPEVYVITPPRNGNNVLDIYPSALLLLPPYRDEDFQILGVAVTYWEALEVVRTMVDDMYQKTGTFHVDGII